MMMPYASPGLIKEIRFNTQDGEGSWFAEALDITPSGAGMAKIAGEIHPEISAFLRNLRPDPNYQYVLMTPMGAYEYWGMNVNGDVFPEISLSYNHHTRTDAAQVALELERRWLMPHGKILPPGDWTKFGYKTFEEALRFRHHINKDPTIAYGDIPLSVWNPTMHRVEVIVRHDREKAKQVGADEIINDLDEGKPRQISMGCRVKFDVCTVCGNISRTTHDYCEHLRTMMGQVLDDGRIVGAINFFPVFFDLSDVIVPAGKESGVLMKIAAMGGDVSAFGDVSIEVPRSFLEPNQLIKTASHALPIFKRASQAKSAEVEKKVLPNAGYDTAQQIASCDPDLPPELLRSGSFPGLLSTLALLGIVLKPSEFQYSALSRSDPALADRLSQHGMVFTPQPAAGSMSISAGDFNPDLANMASSHLPERSAFSPHIGARVLHITLVKKASTTKPSPLQAVSDPVLDKIGSAYTAYRESLRTISNDLELAVLDHFGYYGDNFFGDLLDRHMTKSAAITDRVKTSDVTVGYLCGAFRNGVSFDLWKSSIGLPPHSPASFLLGT